MCASDRDAKAAGQSKGDKARQETKLAEKDRPGFDLGGSKNGNTAGTGLGLGKDASEGAHDRRLPGRRTGRIQRT